ncbi:MAG: GNAT family N-acetyltransferase [Bryobacterales bacterium]|nr:GNAT family N-acetyltransferase [Bryobacterales bacterium]
MAGSGSIGTLAASDLPRVLDLAGFAGWNQTLADLERMLTFAPDSCFGLWCDGRLASTSMAFPYGDDLGWVAMVLTDPADRGKGYGTALTQHALDWLRDRGTAWIKLDASHLGQPLYERMGFVAESRMERHLLLAGAPRPASNLLPAGPLPFSLDRAGFGADRQRLLNLLLPIPGLRLAVLPGEQGYAMLRPGARARHLGPMVCATPEAAEQLLLWALSASAGEPLQWDLNTDNTHALLLANQHGFTPQRVLARMRVAGRQNPPPFAGEASLVYAIGGFDFG